MTTLYDRIGKTLTELKDAGTYKHLRYLSAPMGPVTIMEGIGEVIVFCSNDYLGLANHPAVVEAGVAGLRKHGAGTASVRFICGTLSCHRDLEERLASFLGTEAALTFTSCWNANEGLLSNLVAENDAILSDELNHASIIDAIRLSRQAKRLVYKHADLADLETKLNDVAEASVKVDVRDDVGRILGRIQLDAPVKVVVTDGVFSMEGSVAPLPELVRLCKQHSAVLVVDDSHAVGVLGKRGSGTAEHFGLPNRPDDGIAILTGTLGKALGGAGGGYVAGPKSVIDYLIQRSRPQLFSNALPATIACSALAAIDVLQAEPQRVARLQQNVQRMRSGLRALDFEVTESPTAILPIIIGETAEAIRLSGELLKLGVFVIGFGFPVVSEGTARLRVQMSVAHTDQHIDRALDAFSRLRRS